MHHGSERRESPAKIRWFYFIFAKKEVPSQSTIAVMRSYSVLTATSMQQPVAIGAEDVERE